MLGGYAPIIAAVIAAIVSVPVWTALSRMFGFGATEMARLRSEVKEMSARHATCEQEVDELKVRLAAVEHHHASHFARWLVDARKRIIWVNSKALLAIFAPLGLGRDEVEGKLFKDLIDPLAAAEIEHLEHAALASPGSAVSNLIRLHPDLPVMHVVKVAATGRDGELIYEGIAFRTNDPEISTGIGIVRNAAQRITSIDHLSNKPRD